MKMKGQVLAVCGAQYGSEGKGNFVHHLADRYDVHIRTGGPNAGHTIYHEGRKYVQQVLPCGWTNPQALLYIGPGALIDPVQLAKEVKVASNVHPNVSNRLIIHPQAGVITRDHRQMEGGTKGAMHKRIGSTGEGVGAARADRVCRTESFVFAKDVPELAKIGRVEDHDVVFHALDEGHTVLLEGTQGIGLSLIHGTYPYVTSHDTTPAQLCADAGMPANKLTDVLLVARTYPIRVAGNSGPLNQEISFKEISERVGQKVEERTTVTKKVRRIGVWDDRLFINSCRRAWPTSVALSFVDYLDPGDTGVEHWDKLSDVTKRFVSMVEVEAGCRVDLIGTGGPTCTVIER